MKELELKITYTEQETNDAQAAALDCMKGKLSIKPWECILIGILALVCSLVFIWECIEFFVFDDHSIEGEDLFRAMLYGLFLLIVAVYWFLRAIYLKHLRKKGITDEVIIKDWYNACNTVCDELGGVLLIFRKRKMLLMPDVKPMALSKPYYAAYRAFEYNSGIVVAPADWQPNTYFIPRRVLNEHNGEIEKFLEKKLRKRYKVMGR